MSIRTFTLTLLLVFTGGLAHAQLDLANGLYSRGMFHLAAPEYQKVVDSQPDHPNLDIILYRLGESYRKAGDSVGANAAFARLKLRYPDSPYLARSGLREAEKLLREKKYLEALKVAEDILKQRVDGDLRAGALFHAGLCRAAINHQEEALRYFEAVNREHTESPFHTLASLEAARILQARGNRDEALALYQVAKDNPPTAEIGAEATYQIANLYFDKGDFRSATDRFNTLFSSYPDSSRARKARLRASWSAHNQADYYGALEILEAMPREDRFAVAPEYMYLKANCYRQLRERDAGATDLAISSYERLVRSSPDVPFLTNARYELLLLYFEQGKYVEVLNQTPELITTDAHKLDALWLQARAQKELGLANDAADTYRQLVRDFPDDPRSADALYTAAQETRKTENFVAAAELFGTFAASFPDNRLAANALYHQGSCLDKAGQKDGAVQAWNQLAARYPDNQFVGRALFQTAVEQYKNDQKQEAADAFARLIAKQPDSTLANESRYYLGALQDELEQRPQAEQTYLALLETNPQSPRLEEILHRLGLNLYKQEKFDAAADALMPVLRTAEVAGMPPELLLWLAQHQFDRDDPNAAFAAHEAASLVTIETTPPRLRQVAWFLRGKAESRFNDIAAAERSYQQAINLNVDSPERVDAALKLGDLRRSAGRMDEAVQAYNLAAESAAPLELFSRQARAIHKLGLVARTQKEWATAARRFMAVAVLFDDPKLTPESLALAIDSFQRAGQETDATQTIAELKRRYPDSVHAKRF